MTRPKTGSTPRSLVDRLGVEPGMSVAMIGVTDASLVTVIRQRAGTVTIVEPPRRVSPTHEVPPLPGLGAHRDLVFFQAESAETLALFPRLVSALEPHGSLWVLWPKGRRELGQSAVTAAGLSAGVVDVKAMSVSDRLSALEFVYRPRDRHGRR